MTVPAAMKVLANASIRINTSAHSVASRNDVAHVSTNCEFSNAEYRGRRYSYDSDCKSLNYTAAGSAVISDGCIKIWMWSIV